jgi:hypothetical protein
LNTVDEHETVLGGDELEVDGMHNRPDLPRSLASAEKIILDLVSNGAERVSSAQAEVGEKDSHENRAV